MRRREPTKTDYTGSYATAAGRELSVPYSFRGSLMGEEELDAVRRVVESAETLTAGPEVQAFEREFAQQTGEQRMASPLRPRRHNR